MSKLDILCHVHLKGVKMDIEHEIGDYVVIKPVMPAPGKVIEVGENGQITVLWPSGLKSVIPDKDLQLVISAYNVQILSE